MALERTAKKTTCPRWAAWSRVYCPSIRWGKSAFTSTDSCSVSTVKSWAIMSLPGAEQTFPLSSWMKRCLASHAMCRPGQTCRHCMSVALISRGVNAANTDLAGRGLWFRAVPQESFAPCLSFRATLRLRSGQARGISGASMRFLAALQVPRNDNRRVTNDTI